MILKELLKVIPDDVWVFITDHQGTINGSAIFRNHTKKINYLLNKKVLKVEPKKDTNSFGIFLYIEVEE